MRNIDDKQDNAAPDAKGRLPADQFNVIARELEAIPLSADLELDPATGPDTNVAQIVESIGRIAAGGAYSCTDRGVANTYILGLTGHFVPPKTYYDQMHVEFEPANANSGASQINAFGLGLKKLFNPDGTALASGALGQYRRVECVFYQALDSGAGAFKLTPWSSVAGTAGGIGTPGTGGGTPGVITGPSSTPPGSYPNSLTFLNIDADQHWTVPVGATWVKFQLWGGYSDWFGYGNGGNGFVQGELPVGTGIISTGDILRLMVGAPGNYLNGPGTITAIIPGCYGFGAAGYNAGNTSGAFTVGGSGLSAVLKPGGPIAFGDIDAGIALLVAGGVGGEGYAYNAYNAWSLGAGQSGSGDQSNALGEPASAADIVIGSGGLGGGGGGYRGGHRAKQSPLTQASAGSNYVIPSAVNQVNTPGVNGTLVGPGTGFSYTSRSPATTAASITNSDKSKIIISWN